MIIELRNRTEKSVITYFNMTRDPEIRRFLPQKATTAEEAVADYLQTQLPGASSYGRTIYVDGVHVGDIWCYCIQDDDPNAMISYCVFHKSIWGKGVATTALQLFLAEIVKRFHLSTLGAFTYAANVSSIGVLLKNGFIETERFVEDGVESKYFQLDLQK